MRHVLATLLILFSLPALAQNRGQPGQFDYYVLALSWQPSWCGAKPERATDAGCTRGLGFVVHGLWPQYAGGGYPAACAPSKPVPDALAEQMLSLMPSRKLVDHEWRKHGTCSGADPAAYFDAVAKARRKIRVPDAMADASWRRVERLFAAANPGLTPDMIAMVCSGPVATEIRICLDRELNFRACGRDVGDRCKGDAAFPTMR